MEEILPVDAWQRWDLGGWQTWVAGLPGEVECAPAREVVQVTVEACVEGGVEGDAASFEAMPEAGGGGLGNGMVDPARWYPEGELVV